MEMFAGFWEPGDIVACLPQYRHNLLPAQAQVPFQLCGTALKVPLLPCLQQTSCAQHGRLHPG